MAKRAAQPLIRVTLDSNIYISALHFGGAAARLIRMARARSLRIDLSEAILIETIGVLRDKFGWEDHRLHFAGVELRKLAHIVAPVRTLRVTDDPDDNRILECAIEAGSEYIVTEDTDLLRLDWFEGIRLVSPADFPI
jgi:putative PIN family toxin of toxin-antitoxin system